MANFNRVMLMGHLTRNPELRYTASGMAVCEFGLAVNRRYKDEDETTFVDCVAWAKSGEIIVQHISRGSPLFVEGRLTYETWEGRDGKKRNKLKVTVENFQFLGQRESKPDTQDSDTQRPDESNIPF